MNVTIQDKRNGKVKLVNKRYADILLKTGKFLPYQEPKKTDKIIKEKETVVAEIKAEETVEDNEDISPTTGKPKRQYKRRDMVAED